MYKMQYSVKFTFSLSLGCVLVSVRVVCACMHMCKCAFGIRYSLSSVQFSLNHFDYYLVVFVNILCNLAFALLKYVHVCKFY